MQQQKKNGIAQTTLTRNYERLDHDIYKAVEEAKNKSHVKIEYKGENWTIEKIARENGVDAESLKKYFKQYENIEKAVEEAKKVSREKRGKIEYKGENLTIGEIAKKERNWKYSIKKIL